MKTTLMKKSLISLMSLAIALPMLAQPGSGGQSYQKEKGAMREQLNLTEAQESQMQELRFAHEKDMINLKAKLQVEKLELRKLKQADEPNKKKVYAQIEKVGAARVAMDKAQFDHQLAVGKILTDEQYKIFLKMMAKKGRGMDGHRGKSHKQGKRESGFFRK